MNRSSLLDQKTRRVWAILRLAVNKFLRIDGADWAAAFAFHAFFSLFPLMVLLVTIASFFVDRDTAGKEVIAYMTSYVPISGQMQTHIFDVIAGVIKARRHASAVAFLVLIWGALQSFTTLIRATNHAWDTEVYIWWRTPLKSLALLGITTGAVLTGMALPVLANVVNAWVFTASAPPSRVYAFGSFVIPWLVVFLGLSLFYRLAPRTPTRFAEVWAAALCAAVLLRVAESLFVIYIKNFATLNAVYGAFGGIIALLLWIYISGCIFIFGACLCAAQTEGRSFSADSTLTGNEGTEMTAEAHKALQDKLPANHAQNAGDYMFSAHSRLPWKQLARFFTATVFAGIVLNEIWEMAQMSAYVETAGHSWMSTFGLCMRATAGDVGITLGIYAAGALAAGDLCWGLRCRWNVYATAAVLGLIYAALVEHAALASGRWSYTERMPVVSVLGAGLWPLLQMTLLPSITFLFARWRAGCGSRTKNA